MDRRVGGADFNDLLANLCNKASVAGPSRGGQLRDQSGLVQNRFLNRVHQGTGGGEKRQAAGGPGEVEIKRMVAQQRLDPLLQ